MSKTEIIITIVVAVLSSTGLWTCVQKLMDMKDGRTQMLRGLGHDRIIALGMEYVQRGYITQDEYENLHDYLYIPYTKIKGNGSAERIMKEVDKLPIRPN